MDEERRDDDYPDTAETDEPGVWRTIVARALQGFGGVILGALFLSVWAVYGMTLGGEGQDIFGRERRDPPSWIGVLRGCGDFLVSTPGAKWIVVDLAVFMGGFWIAYFLFWAGGRLIGEDSPIRLGDR